MTIPRNPEVGMRVVYGRSGFNRTGWTGEIISTSSSGYFEVEWDEYMGDPTRYRSVAWANTQLDNRWRNRDKHYIFFDENNIHNKTHYEHIFDCGITKPKIPGAVTVTYASGLPKVPQTKEKEVKILEKQTLVNGVILQDASEEKLISLIRELENDVWNLEAIETGSKRIAAIIEEKQKAIKEVVKVLDK